MQANSKEYGETIPNARKIFKKTLHTDSFNLLCCMQKTCQDNHACDLDDISCKLSTKAGSEGLLAGGSEVCAAGRQHGHGAA